MHVYGLTGGIGSGKSSVAEMFEAYGIPVVSADELSRMVVAKGSESLTAVQAAFGDEVLDENGELDRQAMARIVFSDATRRRELEAILHPRIRERFEQVLDALEKAGHEVVVYEVPLLFEKKLQGDMHAVVLVTASTDTRVARVMSRDTSTREQVLARMNAQMSEAEKRKLADYVIDNEGDLDDLRREVEIVISRFMKLAPAAELRMNEPTPSLASSSGELSIELEATPQPSAVDTVISTSPPPASAPPPVAPQSEKATMPPAPPGPTIPGGLLPPPPKTSK